jgi:hypothetical protein
MATITLQILLVLGHFVILLMLMVESRSYSEWNFTYNYKYSDLMKQNYSGRHLPDQVGPIGCICKCDTRDNVSKICAHNETLIVTLDSRYIQKSFNGTIRNIKLVPELRFAYKYPPHMYHSWQSFWPAILYYIRNRDDVETLYITQEFASSMFMVPTLRGIKKLYPFIHFTVLPPTFEILCGLQHVAAIPSLEDFTANGNLGMPALSMDMNKIGRDVLRAGRDLPPKPVPTNASVLFLVRHPQAYGHHRHVENLNEVFGALLNNSIGYEVYTFNSNSTFCGQLQAIHKTFKVAVAMHGQEVLLLTMLPPRSVVIEIMPRQECKLGGSFCDPLASNNISTITFTNTHQTYVFFDMCNTYRGVTHQLCQLQVLKTRMHEVHQARPYLDRDEIDRLSGFIHAVVKG